MSDSEFSTQDSETSTSDSESSTPSDSAPQASEQIPTGFPKLDNLRAMLLHEPTFCDGTLELSPQSFELYYGKKNARFINLAECTDSTGELSALSDACEPAKFGRGEETVLDETYRKARKMDASEFVTRFDVERSGLLDVVQTGLFPDTPERRIEAELYKLNVYGEGAFFKPHCDTPHRENMCATVVVVFPTPHEGGALVLNGSYTFDAATLLSGTTNTIAYIAFFSDTEHEVLPVTSGHRVTLTYNLYFSTSASECPIPAGLTAMKPECASASAIAGALRDLLGDPDFLPNGGTLGFGLRHRYPFPKVWTEGDPNPLKSLKNWLKGSDHALQQAFRALGLYPRRRLAYEGYYDRVEILLDHMVELDGGEGEQRELLSYHRGVIVVNLKFENGKTIREDTGTLYKPSWYKKDPRLEVHWVTPYTTKANTLQSHYAAYGNEVSLQQVYMTACMIVKIGPADDRFFSATKGDK